MEAKTGKILAISSKPSFDLNDVPRDDLTTLFQNSRLTSVTDTYEPGSTFKILTVAAALEEGLTSLDDTFYCPGYRIIDGQKIKCWKTIGHGNQTLAEAFSNSCNCCFMDLALRLGVDKFYEYAEKFGGLVLQQVYVGRWDKHPSAPCFVYSAQNGDYVVIFKLEDGKATDIKVLYNDLPKFTVAEDGITVRYLDESRGGFQVAVSSEHIYLLEYGITHGDFRKGNTKQKNRHINVFRWDGTPVRRLNFDTSVIWFSVTPDDKYLYFTTQDLDAGKEQVKRFEL